VLTERVSRCCRLTPADAAFLARTQRGRLDLAPTGRRHVYRLTPAGYAGVIVAPTCRLVLRPKVPLRNLFHLLDPDAAPPAASDAVAVAPGDEVLNFLARRFAAHVRERLAAGLQRGYAERANRGPVLQGRLDLPAQLRDGAAHKEQLHSQIDDFTQDIACNRVVRATIERLAASPIVEETVRAQLRATIAPFADVALVDVTAPLFDAAAADPLARAYRPLLDLCRLLLDGLGLNERAGDLAGPAFLLDTERLFERYVTRGVAEAFAAGARATVAAQSSHGFHEPVAGRPDLLLRPDVLIVSDGRPRVVVDAKWKRPRGLRVPTEDVYQMLAYAVGLGVGRAVLVYPGTRDRGWEYALLQAPIRVEVRSLRVTGPVETCRRSMRRLGRRLRNGL
jgi:5-methylcytosine-specific restriction enzyme subunit McrC